MGLFSDIIRKKIDSDDMIMLKSDKKDHDFKGCTEGYVAIYDHILEYGLSVDFQGREYYQDGGETSTRKMSPNSCCDKYFSRLFEDKSVIVVSIKELGGEEYIEYDTMSVTGFHESRFSCGNMVFDYCGNRYREIGNLIIAFENNNDNKVFFNRLIKNSVNYNTHIVKLEAIKYDLFVSSQDIKEKMSL